MKSFADVVQKNATMIPDEIAFIYEDKATTWEKYNDDVLRMANKFIELGLKPGDKISTVLTQSDAFMTIYMAAASTGLVLVPLDSRYKASEMEERCRRAGVKLLLTLAYDETVKENVSLLLDNYKIDHVYTYLGEMDRAEAKPYTELFSISTEAVESKFAPKMEEPLLIIFTGGTTGTPKGVILTHRNLYGLSKRISDTWEFTNKDNMLINLPTNHVGGTTLTIGTQLYSGATAVLSAKFDPEEMLEFVDKYKLTFIGGVSTMYRIIFQHTHLKKYKLTSLTRVMAAGEPVSRELAMKITDTFPNATLVRSWGMTETSGPFTLSVLNDPDEMILNSEGTACGGNEIRIVKSDGDIAEPNEVGDIYVKGDSVMEGYLDEEHNVDVFRDGWFNSEDSGYLNEDGYLFFVGRSKDMFISGGYNVYPAEVEACVNSYAGVGSSCVVPIADETWGEVGVAFVMPDNNTEIDTDKLREFCAKQLADYKVPKKIIVRADLPMTPVGKIAKHEIEKNMTEFLTGSGD